MSGEFAIRCQRLGKVYRAWPRRDWHPTLRDAIARALAARFRRAADAPWRWALRDLSFELRRGETLAVIGANGAGKSTLLRVLARVTPPAEGCAVLRGRVGAVLDVCAGFSLELTGRDNVRLNGAILGLRAREIEARLGAIFDFAGLAEFPDTPLKRYSGGMMLRLGLAVALHLDHDVLLLDDAFYAADAAFRARCAERLRARVRDGAALLVVGHDLGALGGLCARALWIDGGRARADGPIAEVVGAYRAQAEVPDQPR